MDDDIDQLLTVMEDARLEGNAAALARLGRELAEQLGVSEAGGDEYGLWCRFEVTGADGAVASQRMRWLWPGRFMMGSPDGEEGRYGVEGPVHEVVLTRGLWLGEVPVTQALYRAVTGNNPSDYEGDDRPVETVNFDDAVSFCAQLRTAFAALSLRLPTEAQYEYGCRAGTTTARYGNLDDIAWYDNGTVDDEQGTHPVAAKAPNAWGLYDMLGNVFEWCEDRTRYGTPYPARTQYDPCSTTGSKRVFRGGSWDVFAQDVRAARRDALDPGSALDYLGFRLAGGPAPGGGAQEQVPRDGAREAGTADREP